MRLPLLTNREVLSSIVDMFGIELDLNTCDWLSTPVDVTILTGDTILFKFKSLSTNYQSMVVSDIVSDTTIISGRKYFTTSLDLGEGSPYEGRYLGMGYKVSYFDEVYIVVDFDNHSMTRMLENAQGVVESEDSIIFEKLHENGLM